MWGLPDCELHKTQYRYQVQATDSNKNYGKTADLYEYDETKMADVRISRFVKKNESNYFYGVYNIMNPSPGALALEFSVFSPDGQRMLEPMIIKGAAVVRKPSKFKMMPVNDSERKEKKLGSFLPSLAFLLTDNGGNAVPYNGKVKVVVTPASKDKLRVATSSQEDYIIDTRAGDNAIIECPDNILRIAPLNEEKFFKTNKVDHKNVKFKVQLFLGDNVPGNNKRGVNFDKELAPYDLNGFELDVYPGPPKKLMLIEPNSLEFTANQKLETIRFGCFDEWGHKTAPDDDKQWMLNFHEGPLQTSKNVYVQASSGEATLNNGICRYEERLPPSGVHVTQIVSLIGEQTSTADPLELNVFVKSTTTMTSLQVSRCFQIIY